MFLAVTSIFHSRHYFLPVYLYLRDLTPLFLYDATNEGSCIAAKTFAFLIILG